MTLAQILEIEEDLEEETLETEGQEHLNLEIDDKPDLEETEEETIEAFQDLIHLTVKIAETDDHTGKMAPKKETPQEVGLLVKEKEAKMAKSLTSAWTTMLSKKAVRGMLTMVPKSRKVARPPSNSSWTIQR